MAPVAARFGSQQRRNLRDGIAPWLSRRQRPQREAAAEAARSNINRNRW